MTGIFVPLLALALPLAEPPAGPPAPRLDLDRFALPDGAVARLGRKDRRGRTEAEWATFADDGRLVARPIDGCPRVFDLHTGRDVTPDYLKDHRGAVLHFLPGGRHLLVSPLARTCVIVDAVTGARLTHLDLDRERPDAADVTPDGTAVLVTYRDGGDRVGAFVFDLTAVPPDRKQFRGINYRDNWALAGDGRRLYRAWDRGVEVIDVRTGDSVASLACRSRNNSPVLVSADGQVFVTGFDRGLSAFAFTGTAIEEPRPIDAESNAHALSADGGTLFTQHRGRYELNGPLTDYTPQHDRSGVRVTRFARYGRLAIDWFGDRPPVVWDPATGKTVFRFPEYAAVRSIQFGEAGAVVVRHEDRTVRAWEWPTGRAAGEWGGRATATGTELLGLTPTGRATLERDAKESAVVLTPTSGGGAAVTWPAKWAEPVECSRIDPTGRYVLLGSRKAAGVFDLTTGRRLRDLPGSPAHDFSPDGRLVATATATAVRVTELASGKERAVLPIPTTDFDSADDVGYRRYRDWDEESGPQPPRGALQFSADNATVALFTTGGKVLVWAVSDGALLYRESAQWRTTRYGALRPDGRWVAYTLRSQRRLALRDVTEPRADRNVVFLPACPSGVTTLAFSPDGRHLVSGHEDGLCLVWDVDQLIAQGRSQAAPPDVADDLWAALGESDAATAGRAADELARHPSVTVRLLAEVLKPDADPDPKAVAALIEKLGDAEFVIRERAEKGLRAWRELVAPQLKQATAAAGPEVLERLERLIAAVDAAETDPPRLRALRAVEVLERIGTPDAKRLLQSVRGGTPRSALTREAGLAVDRLTARGR